MEESSSAKTWQRRSCRCSADLTVRRVLVMCLPQPAIAKAVSFPTTIFVVRRKRKVVKRNLASHTNFPKWHRDSLCGHHVTHPFPPFRLNDSVQESAFARASSGFQQRITRSL